MTGSFVVTCHSFNQQLTQKQEGREKCTFFCHSHNHVSRGGRSPPELFFSPLSPLDGAPHPLLSLLSTEPSHNSFSLKFSASLTLPLLQQQQPSLLPPLYYILHSPLNPPSLSAPSPTRPVSQSANFRAVVAGAAGGGSQSQSQFAGRGTIHVSKAESSANLQSGRGIIYGLTELDYIVHSHYDTVSIANAIFLG